MFDYIKFCLDHIKFSLLNKLLINLLNKLVLVSILLCSFISIIIAESELPVINIDTKILGKDVIFVFYHDQSYIIHLNTKDGRVYANSNVPVKYEINDKNLFDQYALDLSTSEHNQSISFSVKKDLKFVSVINGEKLDAIKFKTQENQEEDLDQISSSNNDPDAVKSEHDGHFHKLSFSLNDPSSKAAAFIRGNYLWIIFDQQKLFTLKEEGIFSSFETIPSSSGTVIRIKLKEKFKNTKFEKKSNIWTIYLTNQHITESEKQFEFRPKQLANEDGFTIKGNFSDQPVIDFEDPELGENIKAIPVLSPGQKVIAQKEAVEYKILKTIQGLAFVVSGDEVTIENLDDNVKITSDTTLDHNESQTHHQFPDDLTQIPKTTSFLPYIDKNLDILDFNEKKSMLILEASEAEEDLDNFNKNLELARFFFTNKFYHEALDVLNYMKQKHLGLFMQSFLARSLRAVSYTMTCEYDKAKEEYDGLLSYDDVKNILELQLWNNYNNFSLGTNSKSIGFFPKDLPFLKFYSDDKYWPIAFAEIELALNATDLKAVEKLFKELKIPSEGKYSNSIKYYKAIYYKKREQMNLAKQYLLDLTYKSEEDLFNSTRAEFDLIKLRVELNDLDKEEAVKMLNDLRFKWRGDQLEYEILLTLAGYYKDINDAMNALRTHKYIKNAFSNKISNFYVTSEMAKIFNQVFLPGGLSEKMDDFTAVALFFEFKDLNPIGPKGDDIILSIVKRVVKLDLLENAADLLKHQIKYRLNGEKRVKAADNLALILIVDDKPREAMTVLDETDVDNFNFQEYQHRLRLRAQSLIKLEKYDEALKRINSDNSSEAEVLRREILYRQSNWSGYIARVTPDVDNMIAKLEKEESVKQDLLRLAVSYYANSLINELDNLSNKIGTKDTKLKNTIDLMSRSSEPVDIKNLEKSLNIDQMKDLLNKYKNQFLDS